MCQIILPDPVFENNVFLVIYVSDQNSWVSHSSNGTKQHCDCTKGTRVLVPWREHLLMGKNSCFSPTACQMLGITHLSPHNELVHLPYIAVATNTIRLDGEEPLLIMEANTIVGLYPYFVFTNPMFLSTNSLSIVYIFSWEYNSISSHIVVCPLFNITSVH